MSSHRILRVNENIKQTLSMIIMREIEDPRIKNNLVTITKVDTAKDLKNAKVYFVCLNEDKQNEVLNGLNSAKGVIFSYLKKQLRVAFVSTVFPKILWGVGDIQVKNSKLKQAYRVGANGECIFEVVNDRRFIDNFKFGTVITLDDIKKKVLSCMQMVASDAVATLFADTTVSVFEVTAKTEEVSAAIKKQLNEKELIKDMGIEVNTLTAKIFVPEEDMLMIKNAVNSEGDSDEV